MSSALDKLFPFLMLLGPLSPFAAILSAFVFYARHSNRIEPDRRVPAVAFALVAIVCGLVAGFFAMIWGVEAACRPPAFNLCGLWGVFVTGPLAFSLAMVAVGM